MGLLVLRSINPVHPLVRGPVTPEMGAILPGVVLRVLTTKNEKSHGLVGPMEEYLFLIGRLLSHVSL